MGGEVYIQEVLMHEQMANVRRRAAAWHRLHVEATPRARGRFGRLLHRLAHAMSGSRHKGPVTGAVAR